MKKIYRHLLMALTAMMLCAAVLAIGGTTAQAATINRSICNGWNSGTHTFKADLNGNGTSETVTVAITRRSGVYCDFLSRIKITANGHTLLNKDVSEDYIYSVSIRYIRMTTKRNFLQIYGESEDGSVPFNNLYRYRRSDNKLVKTRDFTDYYGTPRAITSVTSDSVKVSYVAQPCMLGYISYKLNFKYDPTTYKLSRTSSIVSASSTLGNSSYDPDGYGAYFAQNKFKTAQALTFYTQPGGSTKAFTVTKGKFVTLTKVKITTGGIYAQFKYGDKTGWKAGVRDYNYIKYGAYFEGVQYRLAG